MSAEVVALGGGILFVLVAIVGACCCWCLMRDIQVPPPTASTDMAGRSSGSCTELSEPLSANATNCYLAAYGL